MNAPSSTPAAADVIAATEQWLLQAVIGLNLCPFAKAVQVKRQIRWVVSDATDAEGLQAQLQDELQRLADTDPAVVETTLLIHPRVMGDFLDFNDFLDIADGTIEALGLEGVLQVASFHPDYQFADSDPDDVANCTNRSPYPTLHLLRESSIEAAIDSLADPDEIYERNIETLQRLGPEGWRQLWVGPATDPAADPR
ncbi:hypothetical protein C7444_108112 [Sphaerotilus hippei]|uniref:PRELI/MSF1 domain-containing protein n=1 Tax=Sphaerotilus hippei TaxID=744406 RepID=A0A318GZN2_9BURK|nr:DUF1415 domain-containing protein [Sphaerotilus hippei]PXW95853.1 hypothetical protein C7444_108112 [Sphaerotilus hippei]